MYVHFKKFCAKFFFDLHIRVWLLFRVPGKKREKILSRQDLGDGGYVNDGEEEGKKLSRDRISEIEAT